MGQWTFTGGQQLTEAVLQPLTELNVGVDGAAPQRILLGEPIIAVPGLVDLHAHIDRGSGDSVGIASEWLKRTGVHHAADGGTYGWASWDSEAPHLPEPVRWWVSLLPEGLRTFPETPRLREVVPDMAEPAAHTFRTPRHFVGFKIRLGQNDRQDDEDLLQTGLLWSHHFHVPLMVHWTGTFLPTELVASSLQPGDVLTHIYAPLTDGETLETRVRALHRARAGQVVLDLGHGRHHFSWKVFAAAHAAGLDPDTISTDVTRATWQQEPVVDLPHVLGRCLAGGMPVEAAMKAASLAPAAYLGLAKDHASWVFFGRQTAPRALPDALGEVLTVNDFWAPVLIIMNGEVMRLIDHPDMEWQETPGV